MEEGVVNVRLRGRREKDEHTIRECVVVEKEEREGWIREVR